MRRLDRHICSLNPPPQLFGVQKGGGGFLRLSPHLSQVNPCWVMWLAHAEQLGWMPWWMVSSRCNSLLRAGRWGALRKLGGKMSFHDLQEAVMKSTLWYYLYCRKFSPFQLITIEGRDFLACRGTKLRKPVAVMLLESARLHLSCFSTIWVNKLRQ